MRSGLVAVHALRAPHRRLVGHVHHRLPGLAVGDQVLEPDHEAVAVVGREQPQVVRAEEYGGDLRELAVEIDAIKTPTLVLHGARDVIVRPAHSARLVRELRARDIPVDYVVFEDEGHGFRREQNGVRAASAIINFFTRSLQ